MNPSLHIIVAVDEEGGFGKNGKIPWNIPEDMKHFKETTQDSVCVMGRRTYEDMLAMRLAGGKAAPSFTLLPNRESYVMTRNEDYVCLGATRMPNMRKVFEKYQNTNKKIFVLGGYRMFVEALSYKPIVHMTIIKGDTHDCDVKFPIKVLDGYRIVEGKETEQCYFVEYHPV